MLITIGKKREIRPTPVSSLTEQQAETWLILHIYAFPLKTEARKLPIDFKRRCSTGCWFVSNCAATDVTLTISGGLNGVRCLDLEKPEDIKTVTLFKHHKDN